MRKISGGYRLFIVFVILWTILSISILTVSSGFVSSSWQIQINTNTMDKNQDIEIQKLMEKTIRLFEKAQKKEFRYLIFFCIWLAPIGFVYGAGLTTGWIIRGFRKDN
ncbi:MAG: hypothetical protein ACYSWS_08840 [Planctomycetota bacterium]|jgi:hypothetical protein